MPVAATVEPSAFAAGSSPAGTRRAIEALRVGELMPKNACCAASRTISSTTDSDPVAACTQNSTDVTAMPALVSSSSLRLSIASATAPPHSAKNTSGTRPAKLV